MEKVNTKLTIETDEVWIIKRRRIFIRSFCPKCNREVSMIPPDLAASLACRDITTIYSFIEGNYFHLLYYKSEKPFICLNSLCSI